MPRGKNLPVGWTSTDIQMCEAAERTLEQQPV